MHDWSDKTIDWQGIDDAAFYIGNNLKKWGRVNVLQTKEKYGTVRVYLRFGWEDFYTLTHPGHAYIRYPKWLRQTLGLLQTWRLFVLLNKVVVPIQQKMYTYLYGRAIKKWPHLREEILSGADYHELLTSYGVHAVRDGERSYIIMQDWHPDNYSAKHPPAPRRDVTEQEVKDALAELLGNKRQTKKVKAFLGRMGF